MSSRANRKRARRQRAAKAQEGRWYVWEPNRRAHPVSDIKAALLAYAARPRRPRPLIVNRDLFEKAKRLGPLGESEATE